jgi:hypothetical protein
MFRLIHTPTLNRVPVVILYFLKKDQTIKEYFCYIGICERRITFNKAAGHEVRKIFFIDFVRASCYDSLYLTFSCNMVKLYWDTFLTKKSSKPKRSFGRREKREENTYNNYLPAKLCLDKTINPSPTLQSLAAGR